MIWEEMSYNRTLLNCKEDSNEKNDSQSILYNSEDCLNTENEE